MLFCVSGADSITMLPHQGFIARTQPNSKLQIRVAGEFMLGEGGTKLAWIGPQTRSARSTSLARSRPAAAPAWNR